MTSPFIPSNILNTLAISQEPIKGIRDMLKGINYNPDTKSFASTDTYRLTDFVPNPEYNRIPFPDYKRFFPTWNTSDQRYKKLSLDTLIKEFTNIKVSKKKQMRIYDSYILLYNPEDTQDQAIRVPSTLLSFLEGTAANVNFLHEFIASLKPINKDFNQYSIEMLQETTLSPIAFRLTIPEGTLSHIILPLKLTSNHF